MGNFFRVIAWHLKSLLRFKGRDDRPTFWPYAGSVVGLAGLVMMAAMFPVFRGVADFAQQHPDRTSIETGPGRYLVTIEGPPAGLDGAMSNLTSAVNLLFGCCIGLLAAAVARRLHDTGRTGLWGLMPVPFILFSGAMMPRMFAEDGPRSDLFFAVFVSNWLYLAALAWLALLLAKPGDPAGNRYGPGKTA
ncbi:MAG TPA: DUF805 domain-containing protein [Allosphingosinicella sp.]|jgi:uncharacterized membrane protein YhaH (DUF805 family)